jgi:integrase
MAVVARKRRSGTVYGVTNDWNGKPTWELVGTSKREAEIRDRAMKREIEAGTYQPPSTKHSLTVAEYCDAWGSKRTNASAPDERRVLRLYALSRPWFAGLRLDETKPAHLDRLVRELQAETDKAGKRRLSDKTIANLVGVLRVVFGAAFRADLCIRNPVVLEPGLLQRRPAEEQETYTAAEVAVMIRHHAIPWPIRVLNALCALGGLREGEACGRRFRDLQDAPDGLLPALSVRDQYDGQKTKTRRNRMVPIHPELAAVLTPWAEEGFELFTGRKPNPDDFIVPNRSSRAKVANHTRSSYYKAFVRSLPLAGIRPRSLHATRHTFISLCRRGGARPDVLERVTHNSSGKIIDRYTHFDWAPLCEAVLCLRLDVHRDPQLTSGNPEESGSAPSGTGGQLPANTAESGHSQPG